MADPKKKEADWSEVLANARKNFGHSTWEQVKGAVAPVLHPIDTAKSIYGLGRGVVSKGQHALGYQGDPASEKAVNALVQYYKSKYGTTAGFKKALAEDPASFISDLSMVAGVGAEFAPGKIGSALKVARAVGSPLELAGEAVGAAGRGAAALKIAQQGGITTRAGEFTSAALKALSNASNGRIGPAELRAAPAFAQQLKATMQKKGVTPAAAREALLAFHEAPTPRSVITQKSAPAAARAKAAELVAEGKTKVSGMAGGPEPSSTSVGEALAEAYKESHNRVQHLYNQHAHGPEVFEPQAGNIVKTAIEQELKDQGLSNFHNFETTTQSKLAHKVLQTQIPTLMEDNDMSVGRLEQIRQELNELQDRAVTPGDRNVIGAMRAGYDKGLETAAKNGFLRTGDPDVFINGLQAARNAHAAHMQTFGEPGIAAAVRKLNLDRDANGLISGIPSAADARFASDTIINSILDAKRGAPKVGGEAKYEKWSDILGPHSADLDDALRQTVTQIPHNEPNMAVTGTRLQNFVDSPLGRKLFPNPEDAAKLRLAGEAQNVLESRPPRDVERASLMSDVAGAMKDRGASMMKGSAITALGGSPWVGAAIGALASSKAEERAAKAAMAAEEAGAPLQSVGANRVAAAGDLLAKGAIRANPARLASVKPEQPAPEQAAAKPAPSEPWANDPIVETAPDAGGGTEDQPWLNDPIVQPARQKRASGGAVGTKDIEHLIEALMTKARKAKKEHTKNTQGLLKHEDSAIVAALDAAKRAI